jgi:hypothetical protein
MLGQSIPVGNCKDEPTSPAKATGRGRHSVHPLAALHKRFTRQIVHGPRAASGKPARLLSSIPSQNKTQRKLSDKSGHAWPSYTPFTSQPENPWG